MWIDSHCHLDHKRFTPENGLNDVLQQALLAGVGGMLSVNCQIREEFPALLSLVKPLQNVWCSVGTHPHEAGREDEKSVSLAELIDLATSDEKIVAIGETGLDYFYKLSTPEDQALCFRRHIQACLATDLPMIVHARDADEDIVKIICEETNGKGMRGVMHCFSSGPALAEEALELGFHISFSGILTFKKSEELREIAKKVPLERLLVETDSPFLAPEPHRGAMNTPAYVPLTGKVLADIHGLSAEEMAAHTTRNFFDLFKKAHLT